MKASETENFIRDVVKAALDKRRARGFSHNKEIENEIVSYALRCGVAYAEADADMLIDLICERISTQERAPSDLETINRELSQ